MSFQRNQKTQASRICHFLVLLAMQIVSGQTHVGWPMGLLSRSVRWNESRLHRAGLGWKTGLFWHRYIQAALQVFMKRLLQPQIYTDLFLF